MLRRGSSGGIVRPIDREHGVTTTRSRLRHVLRETPVLRDLYDAQFHIRRHHARTGRWPNPLFPRTVNDWLLRRLILAHEPLHARLSDKLETRAFVRERLGEDPTVPILGQWDSVEALAADWDRLPHAFVLKPTHGSGWVRLVPDRTAAGRDAMLAEARGWMHASFYDLWREWGYRHVRPRLVAEHRVAPMPGEPTPVEYRFWMFGGRLALFRVSIGFMGQVRGCAFDSALRPVSFAISDRPNRPLPPPAPEDFAWMLGLAQRLTAGIDFLRVDFLQEAGRIWLGELTAYPDAGTAPYQPWAWAEWMGAVWRATRRGGDWPPMPA